MGLLLPSYLKMREYQNTSHQSDTENHENRAKYKLRKSLVQIQIADGSHEDSILIQFYSV